jgi:hypothetical protein
LRGEGGGRGLREVGGAVRAVAAGFGKLAAR